MADDSLAEVSLLDITKLKVPDLKKELKLRGLSTSGNKNELVERLQSALKSSDGVASESVDDLEEDLLNDDDDEHLDGNESVINDIDNALEDSPTTKAQKRKLSENEPPSIKNGASKKVILNRNTSVLEPIKTTEESKTEITSEEPSADKKVIKLSELSVKERLEMRAKKFGVTITTDAKRAARAERFGSKDNSAASIKTNVDTSLDVLKQRAARFGGSVSTVMSNLEKEELLEKRKARFGGATNTNGAVSQSEAAKRRLERFKQPVK